MKEPQFGADGYPTPETLAKIAHWPALMHDDLRGLHEFVIKAWHDTGRIRARALHSAQEIEDGATVWAYITGGWSGNESIIGALNDNRLWWGRCWVSSRRGGCHEFEIPDAPKKGK